LAPQLLKKYLENFKKKFQIISFFRLNKLLSCQKKMRRRRFLSSEKDCYAGISPPFFSLADGKRPAPRQFFSLAAHFTAPRFSTKNLGGDAAGRDCEIFHNENLGNKKG